MCEEVKNDNEEFVGFMDGIAELIPRDDSKRRPKPNRIAILSDSRSAIDKLSGGPDEQDSDVGLQIWEMLKKCTKAEIPVSFQWIPSHVGLEGNEYADSLAAIGTNLDQKTKPIHVEAAKAWIMRKAKEKTKESYARRWRGVMVWAQAEGTRDGIGKRRREKVIRQAN